MQHRRDQRFVTTGRWTPSHAALVPADSESGETALRIWAGCSWLRVSEAPGKSLPDDAGTIAELAHGAALSHDQLISSILDELSVELGSPPHGPIAL
jgi:hypothetical protein